MTRVIVTEEDLLPVTVNEETGAAKCGDYVSNVDADPDTMRLLALRLLSISEAAMKRERESERVKHESWLVEKILPLALVMYKHQKEDYVSPEQWKEFYFNKNTTALRWVQTAEIAYKHLHPEDANK